MRDYKELKELLIDYNEVSVKKYIVHCKQLEKSGKNKWIEKFTFTVLADLFKRVDSEGLEFDGKHITLQSRGISYDYVAYKNKMLIAYPETIIDVQLVFEGDTFKVTKNSGKIDYNHVIADPFNTDNVNIKGGYCVIKNKRGEFFTSLSKKDFQLHRSIAKTDYIWSKWYKEMCLKTLIKKATKVHFNDVFNNMEEEDNKNYDLNKPPQKEELNPDHEDYDKIVDSLVDGNLTVLSLEEKFNISEEVKERLIEYASKIL